VWLLAGGGVLYFAFPALYASSFSGFYLPLMMVLWLLIGRGIAIEFRNHLDSPLWRPFFDVVFAGSSALLAIFFGAALGNVVRGVPLDSTATSSCPCGPTSNPAPTPHPGLVHRPGGPAGVATLTQHGALWLVFKTEDILEQRAQKVARMAWYGVAALTAVVTVATMIVQPQVLANLRAHPWGYVFPALALAGLVGIRLGGEAKPFLASCAYIVGM